MKTDPESFILDNTAVMTPPHVPEVKLRLADEAHDLWLKTEEELEEIGLPPPFWAFAWAGGQGLARYVLDHPEVLAGKRVLDRERAPQAKHVIDRIWTLDSVETAGRSGNNDTEVRHERIPCDLNEGKHESVVNDAQKRA